MLHPTFGFLCRWYVSDTRPEPVKDRIRQNVIQVSTMSSNEQPNSGLALALLRIVELLEIEAEARAYTCPYIAFTPLVPLPLEADKPRQIVIACSDDVACHVSHFLCQYLEPLGKSKQVDFVLRQASSIVDHIRDLHNAEVVVVVVSNGYLCEAEKPLKTQYRSFDQRCPVSHLLSRAYTVLILMDDMPVQSLIEGVRKTLMKINLFRWPLTSAQRDTMWRIIFKHLNHG